MAFHRLTILCGHYGSGKTNIAVNLALACKKEYEKTAIADLDIVNPYFRTKDSAERLERAGVKLISSPFANSNLDIPALPPEVYTVTDDQTYHMILDIGGDDRGAYVLGRLAPKIKEENDYDMYMVINRFRPLTPDAPSTVEVMNEISAACGIPFTGLINNSNLGRETTPEDVLSSVDYAESVAKLSGVPVAMTTVQDSLYFACEKSLPFPFPLDLQPNTLF